MTQILIHNDREYAQYLKNGSGRSGIKSIYIVDLNSSEEDLDNCIGEFKDLERLDIADCRCFRRIPKSIGKLTKLKELTFVRCYYLSDVNIITRYKLVGYGKKKI